MTKNSIKNIKYYLMAVVCATAFFMHETIIPTSQNLKVKTEIWKQAKSKRTEALSKVKVLTIGTKEYDAYLLEKTKTDKAYKALTKEIEHVKYLEFDNFKLFLAEFGWAIGLLIYAVFNLIMTFIKRSDTFIGELVCHSTLIFIALFFVRWCFLEEDYRNITYILINLICVVILVFGIHFLVKSMRNKKLIRLVNWVLKIRNKHFHKVALRALDNEEHYEETIKDIQSYEDENTYELSKIVEQ